MTGHNHIAPPLPGVCVLHPDIKSSSRRGIYGYAMSLVSALTQAGHRTGLLTDLPASPGLDANAIAREIAHPTVSKVTALRALPAYLRHQWGHPASTDVPVEWGDPGPPRDAYLDSVHDFINLPAFYEMSRLAGNKPLLPSVHTDFIGEHGFQVAFTATPMAVQTRRVKLIQTVHDLIILNETLHDLDKAKFKRRLQACMRHADLVVAVSEYTRQEILQRYPHAEQRVVVAHQPLPVDPLTVARSLDPALQAATLQKFGLQGGHFIFFVGAIEQRKNVARLVRAFQQSRARTHCELVLAGPMDEIYARQENIAHLLHDQPCAPADRSAPVRYIGRISDAEKLCLLRQARLFAFPSITEGFGLPVLEAQSMGCPVLTSNTSALREVAEQSAVLVDDPTDTAEIAARLDELIFDDLLRADKSRDGLLNARRFHRDHFAERVRQIIGMVT
jgi:glycosyltransferase involved in cell wall biosynthesis